MLQAGRFGTAATLTCNLCALADISARRNFGAGCAKLLSGWPPSYSEPLNRPFSVEARGSVKATRFRALRVQLAPLRVTLRFALTAPL
jgi:hypothetical protein